MKYVNLGRTGLRVSRLCLGTMNFGWTTDEASSFEILDEALDLGINFIDTANTYGWKMGEGVTEQMIGRWLSQGGGRRDRMVLATKVFGEMDSGPNGRGLSAYHIRKSCEGSLRRLKTDCIDLFQMHHIDRNTPLEEIWQAMEQLTREGKVLYIGSSNFPAWYIAKAQMMAQHRNFLGLVSEQCIFSLADRTAELEVLPAAQHFGLGVLPWSPLGGGILAGISAKAKEGRRIGDWAQQKLTKHRAAVEKYEALCAGRELQPADVALAWVLKNPAITAPIIGPRTLDQLRQNVAALLKELDDEILARLDEIWPGPGGPAPEGYSW